MGWTFDTKINTRLRVKEERQINKILNHYHHTGKYIDKSHFIRCAILALIRKEIESIRGSK